MSILITTLQNTDGYQDGHSLNSSRNFYDWWRAWAWKLSSIFWFCFPPPMYIPNDKVCVGYGKFIFPH